MKTKFKLYKFIIEPMELEHESFFMKRFDLFWSSYWQRVVGNNYPANYVRHLTSVNKTVLSKKAIQVYSVAFRGININNLLITAKVNERIDVP